MAFATSSTLTDRLKKYRRFHKVCKPPLASGIITRMVGLTLEAVGLKVAIGHACQIQLSSNSVSGEPRYVDAEVVGFNNQLTYLMPVGKIEGLQPGAKVLPVGNHQSIALGEHLRGRIINGLGVPIDNKGPIAMQDGGRRHPHTINPLHRHPVDQPLDVGVRAINSLLTVGKGQRLGLFAGSGVGKSVLMGMMTRFTQADIVVVGLIGERGREVKEFVDHILGAEGLQKAVVVASPADEAPLMRLRAAQLATQIAESFRDQGKDVLLLMDSLTRFGQAQREIALAIGEPPATRGYPPSVFSKIPELVERAGNAETGGGSITAFYTVLTEGDDLQDPIADSARAILDGHIVLSRALAEEGVYPAIDVEASISRVMPNIVPPNQLKDAQRFKQLLARFKANRDLIAIGAYKRGSDPDIDAAIERFPHLRKFLSQSMTEPALYAQCQAQLSAVLNGNAGAGNAEQGNPSKNSAPGANPAANAKAMPPKTKPANKARARPRPKAKTKARRPLDRR
ncbi:MAG: flagellum-specific ATP synthase FliI [Alteromonadaceae bacterium]|nr:MAG: flagellum-specific ATP synthase FliI [Alteromonadaceae bacterium]